MKVEVTRTLLNDHGEERFTVSPNPEAENVINIMDEHGSVIHVGIDDAVDFCEAVKACSYEIRKGL